MLEKILKSFFGDTSEREVKKYSQKLQKIQSHEQELQQLSDDALRQKTSEFKQQLANGAKLNDILEPAFACVREASVRQLNMRHFDVQMVGGMVLHDGKIAEMKTGEGKTLVATLAVYLNALQGNGAHVVTVNDYLAKRDGAWMAKIYNALDMHVGIVTNDMKDAARRDAYQCDITYCTNNDLGFDYLRDNLKITRERMVQRDFHFAIVDEVDSILVDEARTPLIISGPAQTDIKLYDKIDLLIPMLQESDYELDEKQRNIALSDQGSENIEKLLREKTNLMPEGNLYDVQNVILVHHINQALKAHKLFQRDVHYLVRDGMLYIIDEFTGRVMDGRRYSDGLHQALEAKEKLKIQMENQTLASITYQNLFRMYPKLSGMTGTALTEEAEFAEIYNLPVISIPTNRDITRIDHHDEIYKTGRERDNALVSQIKECYDKKQPVLVGTVSIEKSEQLAATLKKQQIKYAVLNARHHESEAEIIANAGVPGAVTIATNMAGRGTDIQLGGNSDMAFQQWLLKNPDASHDTRITKQQDIDTNIQEARQQVLDAGGLFVIGTERHESRRIDNQLRGRSGRQGDKGETRFYISLEDDLMRIFGSDRLHKMLTTLGLQEGEAIIHPWISRALEKAQKKVEEQNFEIRKQLLRFDDVMNDQRQVIFERRRDLMASEDLSDVVDEMRETVLDEIIARAIPSGALPNQWDVEQLDIDIKRIYGFVAPIKEWANEEGVADTEIFERLDNATKTLLRSRLDEWGVELSRYVYRTLVLQILDDSWKEHLQQLDQLRQGIGLRAYAQRDPLLEYKREAFDLFGMMLDQYRERVVTLIFRVELHFDSPPDLSGDDDDDNDVASDDPSTWGKTPRNAPCPCGSGKKYKNCCYRR